MRARSCVIVPVLFVILTSYAASAEVFEVKFELAEPKIITRTKVEISGKTNLPEGTRVTLRTDLTARPDQMARIKGTKLSQESRWAPTGQAIVSRDGSFAAVLREPHRFKSGKYRVTAQVWVYRYSMFGKSTPQSADFYKIAGPTGECLRGESVDVQRELLAGHVAVVTSDEFQLREAADRVAAREKRKLVTVSRSINEAYELHKELRAHGHYEPRLQESDLRKNRVVATYGTHLRTFRKSIRSVETQEAFFLLTEVLDALEQLHRWAGQPKPAKYAQAMGDYAAAKQRLDELIADI